MALNMLDTISHDEQILSLGIWQETTTTYVFCTASQSFLDAVTPSGATPRSCLFKHAPALAVEEEVEDFRM